eukprot:scaffold1629_cov369-Prasinococcus_capsulatus_cf.AAC.34
MPDPQDKEPVLACQIFSQLSSECRKGATASNGKVEPGAKVEDTIGGRELANVRTMANRAWLPLVGC